MVVAWGAGEVGDLGCEGAGLAEEAGDDVVAGAGEVAEEGVFVLDADGVFVVGIGGFGEEGEFRADFERGCEEVDVMVF